MVETCFLVLSARKMFFHLNSFQYHILIQHYYVRSL